jgi:hypothetical protein
LEQMSSRLGTTIDGVLGHNFLSGNVVEIDYPNRLLRIGKRPTSSLPVVASLPFRYHDDSSSIVVAGVMVNGHKVSATIDTGSDGTFKLTPAAVDSLGLTEAARSGTPSVSVGYKGTTQNTLGRIEEIVIGDIRQHSVAVVFFAKGTGRDQKALGREYRERLPARLHRDPGLSAQADHASAAVRRQDESRRRSKFRLFIPTWSRV